ALARAWLARWPRIPMVNAYGPTECSDDVTHHILREPPAENVVRVPIGRPIANLRIYILDRALQPVPIEVAGEIYVGGVGVGRGYLHQRELTERAFIADPYAKDAGARLYRTGDLGRRLSDGTVEFLGRVDHQVKVRGCRIELEE